MNQDAESETPHKEKEQLCSKQSKGQRSRWDKAGEEAGCLPVIFPLASKGGCQLTMTARGFPSRVMTVKSLGAEVGAVR